MTRPDWWRRRERCPDAVLETRDGVRIEGRIVGLTTKTLAVKLTDLARLELVAKQT